MDLIKKEKYQTKLFEQLTKIGNMKNQLMQMKAYLEIGDFLANIYNDGYKEGFKSGKKSAFNITKN